ncbi:Bcr/CflA family drug resistance efflux transporter [Photobacterium profundum]|uniref:Bcr/CflA family efflux transporter n=1 Tax=Photobacterium profundum 3TCK TaxID=314280 RepID=Q1Z9L2_9GAMM|nr:multidrug effflux MFS transporter [Photobacterium profundum]EAS45830.1 putative multidrug resistance protein [Photobacterium profundum 3TCK]PSV63045.1 Bcr/CflA family drug resistance efflux transporter [Photobacterium profundum]
MKRQQNSEKPVVIMMILLILFSPIAIDIYLPAMPQMADYFGVNIVNVQDTITWFIFSLGFGQLVAGPMADRYGRRPVALVGIAIYCASSWLAYEAYSFELMLVARLLQGFGACATTVIAFTAARDFFGSKRSGQMISYLNGFISFVPALAPILGGWITINYGWKHNFSFMVVYSIVAGLFVLLFFKETKPENTDIENAKVSFKNYMPIATNPTFIFHVTMCLLAMAVILSYVSAAPGWLMVGIGLDINQFTMWFGFNAIINIAGCMLAPKFTDTFGSYKTLVTGLSTIIFAGLLMTLIGNNGEAWGFMVPICIATVGAAFILGSAAGKALAPFGHCAGTAAALLGLFQMSGASILVSLLQKIKLEAPDMMAVQMFLLIPSFCLIVTQVGKKLNETVKQ